MKDMERRTFSFELRNGGEDEGPMPKIVGYAALFNSLSVEMHGFFEKIAPGAFKKTLQESDVRALWNHDTGKVLGRTKAGTLKCREDERGLAIEINPPESAEHMIESMKRGDVDQMSFGFEAIRDMWEEDRENKTVTRTLLEVRLYEVSVVAFPAYPETSVSVRAIEAAETRKKFLSTGALTMPGSLSHIADHRRMTLALAERRVRS